MTQQFKKILITFLNKKQAKKRGNLHFPLITNIMPKLFGQNNYFVLQNFNNPALNRKALFSI